MVRMAAAAALIALAGCAGMEPAGRNASRTPAPRAIEAAPGPTPVARESVPMTETAPAPTPAPVQQAAPAQTAAPAPQAEPVPPPQPEPEPAAAPPARSAAASGGSGADIVVPGQTETQARPPGGDPRSIAERREDIRAWDRCVMRAQGTLESDPTRPQLESAEEVCRRSLGMADRRAVPESRLRRER